MPERLSPEEQRARDDAYLSEVKAGARIATAWAKLAPDGSDLYGAHCEVCDKEWCLPADRASCPHKAVCESCYPNGCDDCIREVEETLRRREEAADRIISAAMELRVGADDLTDTDLRSLDWRQRGDVLRHLELASEALRRVRDTLAPKERP